MNYDLNYKIYNDFIAYRDYLIYIEYMNLNEL